MAWIGFKLMTFLQILDLHVNQENVCTFHITRTFKILLFLSNPEKYIYFYRTFIEVFSMMRRIQKFLAPVFFPLHILPLQRILLADSCWTKKELTHARERKNIFTTLSCWNLVGVKPITTCSMTCKNNN